MSAFDDVVAQRSVRMSEAVRLPVYTLDVGPKTERLREKAGRLRERNKKIVGAVLRGATVTSVADRFGLTHGRISQIMDEYRRGVL